MPATTYKLTQKSPHSKSTRRTEQIELATVYLELNSRVQPRAILFRVHRAWCSYCLIWTAASRSNRSSQLKSETYLNRVQPALASRCDSEPGSDGCRI